MHVLLTIMLAASTPASSAAVRPHQGLCCSIDDMYPTEPQATKLVSLIQSSDYVVVARLEKRHYASPRLTDDDIAARTHRVSPGESQDTGLLYTVQLPDLSSFGTVVDLSVDRVLCARTDFLPSVRRPTLDRLLVFQTRDHRQQPMWGREGETFLAFLAARKDQADILQHYELSAGAAYYEAVDGVRGVLPASMKATAVVTKICTALEPLDVADKVKRLEKLRRKDKDLAEAAAQAIAHVRCQQ